MDKTLQISLDGMGSLAEELLSFFKKGVVVFLIGGLGAGKTTLVREIGERLGVCEQISSPSFSLINVYTGADFPIAHFDLFRLSGGEDLEHIGADDFFSGEYAVFIEWPEHGRDFFPIPDMEIFFELIADGEARKITIKRRGIK